jgi:hypothetical protein
MEFSKINKIAVSAEDKAVLMLNLNRYVPKAAYPNGELYINYMRALNQLLEQLGGRILWQMPSFGQPLGGEKLHEIIAIWYPSHKAFLNLREMPGSAENFKLRGMCVEYAVLHRCPGDMFL